MQRVRLAVGFAYALSGWCGVARAEQGLQAPARPAAVTASDERSLVGTEPAPTAYWVTIGVLWAASSALIGLSLDERRVVRWQGRSAEAWATKPLADRYNRMAVFGVSGLLLPNLVWSASTPFLPREPAPWVPWVASIVGLGLSGTALTLALTVSPCNLGEVAPRCGYGWADPLIVPLLMLQAVAPLSIPLAYLIASAFDTPPRQTRAQLMMGNGGAGLLLTGQF